jgi:hypothetical protein
MHHVAKAFELLTKDGGVYNILKSLSKDEYYKIR